jgi:hypothetical protein
MIADHRELRFGIMFHSQFPPVVYLARIKGLNFGAHNDPRRSHKLAGRKAFDLRT